MGRRRTPHRFDPDLFNRSGERLPRPLDLEGAFICPLPKNPAEQKQIPAVKAIRLEDKLWVVESAAWRKDGSVKAILRKLQERGRSGEGAKGREDEPWTGCRVKVGKKVMVIGPVGESRSVVFSNAKESIHE
ncbi:MAG TPA: hypothetical protein VK797_22665 [Tepidisphaeraceae bacterium]|jgi:hypothetical protein|nr:hypothetical protein [Tepidisphaeraceae bacterium]